MLPKKIYLNYIDEDDDEKTWSEEPVGVADCDLQSREYTDLSQVWHPASEPPLPNKDIIVAAYNEDHDRCDIWHISLTPDIIADFSRESNFLWAYVNDLLPSASCSEIPNNSSKKSNSWKLLRPTLK